MAVAAVVLTGRHLTRPLAQITEVLHRLSLNEDGVVIPDQDRGDEIGALALAAEEFRQVLERERDAEQRTWAGRTAAQAARDTAQQSAAAAEQARHEAEAARNFHAKKAAIADAFFEAFSRIISHAERGDFSQRIGIRFDDENYDALT